MNVESIHEEKVIDNDNKESEKKEEDVIVNNEPEIQKQNSDPIEDDNKKLKTVNEEITYEEKTDDIKVNTLNDNKETNQVIDEPIQEEDKEPNQNAEENSKPIEEEKNDNNPPLEEEANKEEPTDPEIKERNKVVDTYLAELDNKDGAKKEEPILSSNQDEPDEFEKADLEYRKKKEEEEQHNQEEEQYPNEEEQQPQIEEHQTEETPNNNAQSINQSPPNEENSKSISRNHQYSTVRSNSLIHQRRPFKPIIYKRPEDLYIKEIEHYKRIQMIKKMNGKVDFNVSKKIRQSEVDNINQEEDNTDNNEENKKNELNQSDMIKYISTKNANTRYYLSKPKPNIKQLRAKYEQKILRILNDKANPYSNSWTNQILASRYQVNLKVNGFLNGVPQFKIKKLKDCELPNIYYPSSTKVSKYRTSQRMSYENKQSGNIQFPLILRFFGENKDEK